jgi:two-component system sensor histidine kinase PilS (NtrC family)
MLLVVSIAFGSAVMRGKSALAFAAIATFCILGEQLYAHIYQSFPFTAYSQSGMLSASFFAMAALSFTLTRYLRESEQLASQRELDLANLEQLNEYVIRHMQVGIMVVDMGGRVRLINETAAFLLDKPETQPGKHLMEYSEALALQLAEWIEIGINPSPIKSASGNRELQATFARLGEVNQAGSLLFLDDLANITQRAQQMKLASLGRLTASIAHEIRNPLGAISHAEQLLSESAELSQADNRLTEIIHTNSIRVNQIVDNILQLSRRKQPKPETISLHRWIENFVREFCQNQPFPEEQILYEIQPEDLELSADSIQLRQLLTILCDNASCHHKEDGATPQIWIYAQSGESSSSPSIEIRDNGPGIPEEILNQIFEPFFTTRSTGSGLGLYIARELSEANRWRLEHFNPPEGGSCFRLSFPKAIGQNYTTIPGP